MKIHWKSHRNLLNVPHNPQKSLTMFIHFPKSMNISMKSPFLEMCVGLLPGEFNGSPYFFHPALASTWFPPAHLDRQRLLSVEALAKDLHRWSWTPAPSKASRRKSGAETCGGTETMWGRRWRQRWCTFKPI